VFAAAKADLQPERARRDGEGGVRRGRLREGKAQAGQGFVQQELLARAQRMTPLAPVQPVRRRFYRRSCFSD
jgi:hypothetical protein